MPLSRDAKMARRTGRFPQLVDSGSGVNREGFATISSSCIDPGPPLRRAVSNHVRDAFISPSRARLNYGRPKALAMLTKRSIASWRLHQKGKKRATCAVTEQGSEEDARIVEGNLRCSPLRASGVPADGIASTSRDARQRRCVPPAPAGWSLVGNAGTAAARCRAVRPERQ